MKTLRKAPGKSLGILILKSPMPQVLYTVRGG